MSLLWQGVFLFFIFFVDKVMTQNRDWTAVPQRGGRGMKFSRESHMHKHIIYRMYSFAPPPPALCQCCVMNSHHGLRNPSPIPQTTHRSHSRLSVTRYMSFSYVLKQMKTSCQHAMYHFKSHLNNFDCPALILGWFACPYHAFGGSWRTRIIASQPLPVAPERSLW